MTIGDVPDDITKRVNNDPVEKVKQFKYFGSLKSTDAECYKDVNARIAMAKRIMCELTTLWFQLHLKRDWLRHWYGRFCLTKQKLGL